MASSLRVPQTLPCTSPYSALRAVLSFSPCYLICKHWKERMAANKESDFTFHVWAHVSHQGLLLRPHVSCKCTDLGGHTLCHNLSALFRWPWLLPLWGSLEQSCRAVQSFVSVTERGERVQGRIHTYDISDISAGGHSRLPHAIGLIPTVLR